VSGTEETPVEMGRIVVKGEEGCGKKDEGSGAEEVSIELFQARA